MDGIACFILAGGITDRRCGRICTVAKAVTRAGSLFPAAVIAACGVIAAAGLCSAVAAPKAKRPVPIMVPIGCLMSPPCGERGFEAAARSSVVTSGDIARGGASVSDRTSSDPRVYGVNEAKIRAAASEFLRTVREELRRRPRADLLTGREQPAERIIDLPPLALQLKASQYLASEDFLNCSSVFAAFDRAGERFPAGKQRSDMLWALYSHYIDSCYRGALRSLGSARDRIVVLLRQTAGEADYSLYCLGFNFAANYVLTARHCLVEPDEVALMLGRYKAGDADAVIDIAAPSAETRALVLGEPGRLYGLRLPASLDQERKFFPFERDRDLFILELDAAGRRNVPAFPVAQAAQWDEIAIPAIFPDDAALSAAIRSRNAARVTEVIDGASAIDVSPMCSLVMSRKSTKPFVHHACQTRYGYSGGPILLRRAAGAVALVGVHVGSVDPKDPVDQWPYRSIPNYGLRLPPQVMELGRR
jgi:hypothetical protein